MAEEERNDLSLLNSDLEDYADDFVSLIRSRSMRATQELITASSLIQGLERYYENTPVVLLMYFYLEAEESLRVWGLTAKGIQFVHSQEIDIQQLEKLEKELKKSLELDKKTVDRAPRKRALVFSMEQSTVESREQEVIIQELSDLLFPMEVGSRLKQNGTEHLIILPALNIQQIPLAILTPFEEQSHLIESFSYSFVPSLSLIKNLRPRTKQTELSSLDQQTLAEASLVVGNPEFPAHPVWKLPPLPGADEEVKLLSNSLQLDTENLLIGSAATKSQILAKASRISTLLYFATHGVADPQNALDGSGLFFAGDESDQEGFWTSRDIQHSRLSASLVILSACQTGLGMPQDAGVIGLFRAFTKAGVKNVIMSLWSVDDQATQELMQIFMEEIQKPQKYFPAGHLRKAMLTYKEQRPDPIFWAAFANFGNPY